MAVCSAICVSLCAFLCDCRVTSMAERTEYKIVVGGSCCGLNNSSNSRVGMGTGLVWLRIGLPVSAYGHGSEP